MALPALAFPGRAFLRNARSSGGGRRSIALEPPGFASGAIAAVRPGFSVGSDAQIEAVVGRDGNQGLLEEIDLRDVLRVIG
jgi:hypothetical protein